jgi:hypothetical protein
VVVPAPPHWEGVADIRNVGLDQRLRVRSAPNHGAALARPRRTVARQLDGTTGAPVLARRASTTRFWPHLACDRCAGCRRRGSGRTPCEASGPPMSESPVHIGGPPLPRLLSPGALTRSHCESHHFDAGCQWGGRAPGPRPRHSDRWTAHVWPCSGLVGEVGSVRTSSGRSPQEGTRRTALRRSAPSIAARDEQSGMRATPAGALSSSTIAKSSET